MRINKKISVLIPCHNEESGIASVINGIPVERLNSFGYSIEIIIIDNNSHDKTASIALTLGAKVIKEKKKGKGHAIKAGFKAVSDDTDYVVMLDGDNTYKGHELLRLIEPLDNNFCDVIVGSRLGGKINKNAWKFQNRIVNWVFTFLVRQQYQANITDVLSGYFAWKKQVVDDLVIHIESSGFAIEMEMISKMVKLGYNIYSVPITYDEREGNTKISSITDGSKILFAFLKYAFWSPPNYNLHSKFKLKLAYKHEGRKSEY